jgi:cell division protease FtsH
MLGGRAAEELIFNEMTTGASDDISKATQVSRAMVAQFGMSELGPINLDGERRSPYEQSEISPEMAAKIDAEVKKIMDDSYVIAQKVLKKHKNKLDIIASELLKKETIDSEDFVRIIGPKKNAPNSKPPLLATV